MGAFAFDLPMWQDLFNASGSSIAYNFEPNVTYNFGPAAVTVGGDFGNDNGHYWGVAGIASASTPALGTTVTNYDVIGYLSIPFGGNQINIGGIYGAGDSSNSATSASAIFVDYRVFF